MSSLFNPLLFCVRDGGGIRLIRPREKDPDIETADVRVAYKFVYGRNDPIKELCARLRSAVGGRFVGVLFRVFQSWFDRDRGGEGAISRYTGARA